MSAKGWEADFRDWPFPAKRLSLVAGTCNKTTGVRERLLRAVRLRGKLMKTIMTALAVTTLVLGTAACSGPANTETEIATDSSIAGTWRGDPSTAQAENADSNYTLIDGAFTCNSCIPPFTTLANGEWQVVDRPGSDEQMIEVIDDRTIKSSTRFEGRDLGNSTWMVSEDGSTMTQTFVNLDGEVQTEGSISLSRTADAPEGAHAMSGGWALAEYGDISEAGLLTTYSLDGDTLSSSYNGGSWSAVIGGDPVAIEGSESGTMVSVEKTTENTYRETYTLDGTVVGVAEMTIEGDTMSIVSTDPRDESVFRYTATRQ